MPEVLLRLPLGSPHEARVAEELAVRGLVLVGVPVPVGTVRAPGLGLVDRAALDPDGLGEVVLHALTVLPGPPPGRERRTGWTLVGAAA